MEINKHYKALFFSFGWFHGEPFKLFSFSLIDCWDDGVTIFDLQVTKLCFAIGVYLT